MEMTLYRLFFFGVAVSMALILTACEYSSNAPPPCLSSDILLEMPPIAMVATTTTTMAVGTDGSLWGKGDNIRGALGDGTTSARRFFDQVGTDTDWAMIDTGRMHVVAIKTDGSLWAWGHYGFVTHEGLGAVGTLGDGTTVGSSVPIQIGTDTNWAQAAAGSNHSIAIKTDGSLWAWGSNSDGQLGNGSSDHGGYFVPTQIGTDTNWSYVAASYWHTFAIKMDGSLWGWGNNDYGQLGNGTTTVKAIPMQIDAGSAWTLVATGSTHTVAIKTDGSLWAWGNNGLGQIGDGTRTDRLFPVRIGIYSDWVSIAAGEWYTIATREDGSLWVWGENSLLHFGDLDYRDPTVPTQIYSHEYWNDVAAGSNRAFAITKDGRIQRLR